MPSDIYHSLTNTRVAGKKLMIKVDARPERRSTGRRVRDNRASHKPNPKNRKPAGANFQGANAKSGKAGKRKKRKMK